MATPKTTLKSALKPSSQSSAKPATKAASKLFDVDALWALQRPGAPSLSPDGAQAVVSLMSPSMESNESVSALWLLSTLGGEPRALTSCGEKDGAPQWSPARDDGSEHIAFVAKREQEGKKDEEPQLYLIAPDGGEARRLTSLATGVEAFKWFPDGRHIAFVSWVWPGLEGTAAQAKAMQAFKERKTSAYVTSEALYRFWDHNLPMGRVPHLHIVDVDNGKVRDLFEGSEFELSRSEPDVHSFDISADGRHIVFAHDPAPEKKLDNPYALAELDLRKGQIRTLLQHAEWDFAAPRYHPEGRSIALLARHQGKKHTMPQQLALLDASGHWEVISAAWDQEATAPLAWSDDGTSLLFAAEETGRRHLWQFDIAQRAAQRLFEGGHVSSFDLKAGRLVVNHDSVQFPPRVSVLSADGSEPQRIERFNSELLARHAFGRHEEVWFKGALGESVQMWLVYPPDFKPNKKTPLLHLIHGGPHTAFGDSWHWRWNHQVFAAQGYVLANVNYHGSSSFGNAFLDSITERWGELELQDIEAATEWLLKKPWADKKRLFAAGGSYGGYMVAWMNGHALKQKYQAYICHAGCYDWQAMFADDAYGWHKKELGAAYWDDPAKIAAQSPHAFAQNMNTPTLVIHGAQDYRVPDAQGLAYYNTLKARGVDSRLVWFPDENHWVLKPRNSKLWYGEFFAWLSRHDGA